MAKVHLCEPTHAQDAKFRSHSLAHLNDVVDTKVLEDIKVISNATLVAGLCTKNVEIRVDNSQFGHSPSTIVNNNLPRDDMKNKRVCC